MFNIILLDFFSKEIPASLKPINTFEEGNDEKEGKHLITCPHKDRKHYAKVFEFGVL